MRRFSSLDLSNLTPEVIGSTAAPGLILIASLMGSGHCVGMCGPIAAITAQSKRGILTYHFGRLVIYLLLGWSAAQIGQHLFRPEHIHSSWFFKIFSVLTALSIGAFLILMGTHLRKRQPPHFQVNFFQTLFSKIYQLKGPLKGFLLGLFSTLLPCGWLWAFVAAAGLTQSPPLALIVMFFFWLGTLPAMTLAPQFLNRLTQVKSTWVRNGTSWLLITAGVLTISMKIYPIFVPIQSSCH